MDSLWSETDALSSNRQCNSMTSILHTSWIAVVRVIYQALARLVNTPSNQNIVNFAGYTGMNSECIACHISAIWLWQQQFLFLCQCHQIIIFLNHRIPLFFMSESLRVNFYSWQCIVSIWDLPSLRYETLRWISEELKFMLWCSMIIVSRVFWPV